MRALPDFVEASLEQLDTVSLEEMNSTAALLSRKDRKYVVPWTSVATLIDALQGSHRLLQIDDKHVFDYDTIYYDTDTLSAFRAHMQGRRRRYKVRARTYVDSDLRLLEVKVKGHRGETVKSRIPAPPVHDVLANADGRAFVEETVLGHYPDHIVPELRPSISTLYRRFTLAAETERVTIDFDLRYTDADGDVGALRSGFAIIESKSAGDQAAADRILRGTGARPVNCSKYCVGIALRDHGPRANELLRLLSRHFRPAGPSRTLAPALREPVHA